MVIMALLMAVVAAGAFFMGKKSVNIPDRSGEKQIIIDSKVSLIAYLEYV